ncbi:hypothetical protein BUE80_DR006241 [Diplocarpon rosae]|nr:hypothetical protein BUE80_DR006241 [Diplocarpon rosae]
MDLVGEPVDIDKVIVQEDFRYGDHELQRLTVYHHFGRDAVQDGRGLFIIYIHGGAWRDPSITEKSFYPTIRALYSTTSQRELMNKHVTGIASISYRLSAHPDHPQDPTIPATERRDAQHPEHLQDVVASISFLQAKYGFGSRYLLVGHSCGATLAFQSLNPEVIVGVAGIYDLRLLRYSHSHPAYQEFIVGAFGDDEKAWDSASPANFHLMDVWPEARTVVLASSSKDGLVDNGQIDCMGSKLATLNKTARVLVLRDFLDLPHDDIWEKGVDLARVVAETLKVWEAGDSG